MEHLGVRGERIPDNPDEGITMKRKDYAERSNIPINEDDASTNRRLIEEEQKKQAEKKQERKNIKRGPDWGKLILMEIHSNPNVPYTAYVTRIMHMIPEMQERGKEKTITAIRDKIREFLLRGFVKRTNWGKYDLTPEGNEYLNNEIYPKKGVKEKKPASITTIQIEKTFPSQQQKIEIPQEEPKPAPVTKLRSEEEVRGLLHYLQNILGYCSEKELHIKILKWFLKEE